MNTSQHNDSYVGFPTNVSVVVMDSFLFLTISVVATFGSIVVFICYKRFHSLRTVTNVFILSLSASDLLVALFSIPLSFSLFVFHKYDKSIYYVGDMTPSILSIYSLALVAVDRALAITKPYFHQEKVTRKSAWVLVAITWVVMLCYSLIGMMSDKKSFTISAVLVAYVIPVVIMVLSYTVMGFVAKRHAKELNELDKTMTRFQTDQPTLINEMQRNINGNRFVKEIAAYDDNISINSPNFSRENPSLINSTLSKTRHLKRELKAALTLSMILSCFIITWTPFMSLNIAHFGNKKVSEELIKYFKILHYANSALNPILYVVLNQRWRKAFKKVLCFCKIGASFQPKQNFTRSGSRSSYTKPSIGW